MSSLVRDKPLDLYGPKGLSSFFKSLHGTLGFAAAFRLRIKELSPGDTIERAEYQVRTTLAKHDITCLAYAMEERERPGHFHPEVARRLGVPEGPLWKQLQNGKSVEVEGKTIETSRVTGPGPA